MSTLKATKPTTSVVKSTTTPSPPVPAKTPFVPVDKETITRAATALLTHLKKTAPKNALLEETVSITLSIHLHRIPGRYIAKPVQIPLPHTLLNPEDGIEICVISKDPTDELKEKLLSTPVAGITKVLAVGKLKKNYHEFGKRRELVNRYDAFFCDDRVVTMMPKLCGKVFFDRKKLPVPVRVTGSAAVVAKEITKARDSTYMIVGAGQTIAVRIGKNNMTPQQITDNVYAVLSTAIDNIPKKWKAVGSLYLQATGTVALPLYKVLPSLTVATDEDDEDDDNNDEDNEKYRYLNENLDDEEDDEEEVEEEEKEEKTTKKSSTGNTGSAVEVGKKRTRPTETTTTTSVPTSTKSTVIATNKSAKATASVSTEKATTVSSNKTESTKSTTTATSAKKSRTLEPPASKSKSSNTNTQVGIKGNK